MSQRLLLLGADGQVGWELRRALLPLGEVVACTRTGVDLADSAGLEALLERVRPDVIVNAAAYTAVDQAEREPDPARRINADAPGLLARYAASENAWLVHYSTDFAFDGTGTVPWTEADAPRPQNVYGQSKLLGEAAIVRSGCRHLVFRTSWVYAARGQNFAKTMLRLALTRDSPRVVADQTGVPTSADLLADVTALALYGCRGIRVHMTGPGCTTWHGYARHVLARAGSPGSISWSVRRENWCRWWLAGCGMWRSTFGAAPRALGSGQGWSSQGKITGSSGFAGIRAWICGAQRPGRLPLQDDRLLVCGV